MGIKKYIENPETLWRLFEEYRSLTKNRPILVQDFVGKDGNEVDRKRERPLTFEGFENHCAAKGVIQDLGHYFANTDKAYEEFRTICSRIKREIRQDQIEGGMAGIYNPSITQRLNNLVEKVQEDGNKNITVKVKYESKGTGNSSESTASGAEEGPE